MMFQSDSPSQYGRPYARVGTMHQRVCLCARRDGTPLLPVALSVVSASGGATPGLSSGGAADVSADAGGYSKGSGNILHTARWNYIGCSISRG